MKMKSVVLMAVALGFGFVAMLGVRQAMNGKNAPLKTKRILVAKRDIIPYTKLEFVDVGFEEWPVDKLPEGAITDKADFEDRGVVSKVTPKSPITKGMLTEKHNFGVANNIPEGMRSYTIKVNSTQTHSGLIKRGDKVDIMVTYKRPDNPAPRTKTVLEMIEVFSLDQEVAQQQEDAKAKQKIENLLLLVTPEQAQRLSQAQAKGTLEITLRNPNDKTKSNANMLTDEDFEGLEASVGVDRNNDDDDDSGEAKVAKAAEPPKVEPAVKEEPVVEEPVAEPVEEEVVAAAPAPAPWIITIYENDTVRHEEILPIGSPAPQPEPASGPGVPTRSKPAPRKAPVASPNGPSATDSRTKPSKSASTPKGTKTASLGS